LTRLTEAETPESGPPSAAEEALDEERRAKAQRQRLTSITSKLDEAHYAVLPEGEKLQGWSPEDVVELNDHVRHMLHSRREKFKRGMKGFGQYVRKRKHCPSLFFVLCSRK
jgi:hypothetical protein